MSEPELFIKAQSAFTNVVDQIKDDQWDIKLAVAMQKQGQTVRESLAYHIYDTAWVGDVLDGITIAAGKKKYAGDLVGSDPLASWHRVAKAAEAAVNSIDDLDSIVHLSYGDYSAREYLQHITTFVGLQAWDYARALGVSDKLPDDLVRGLWDMISPMAEQWRAMGVFGPRVSMADDATLQDKLLAITGRRP